MLNPAKEEGETARRDALWQDLRKLATAWPADAAVRDQLDMALGTTVLDSEAGGDADRTNY